MIYSLLEYSKTFLFKGKRVSISTLARRCEKGMLPCNHRAIKLPGKTGSWVIEVLSEIIEPIKESDKSKLQTISRKNYSFR